MEAKQKQIVEFLSTTNTQFTIPVYQRNYDWEEKQCLKLFDDISKVATNIDVVSHFIGSIVYLHEGVYTVGKKEFSIIDGQQRLTTLTLLLCAIYHKARILNAKEISDMIYDRYLTDRYINGEDKFKLIPVGENLEILKKIMYGKFDDITEEERSSNMYTNYKFFEENIESLETITQIDVGIQKLIYVDIALERGKDDPQKIFESLNSTGLDLSQGDLIRNFVLMNLQREEQSRIYSEYWIPIENNTKLYGGSKINTKISDFMRDFLTLEFGKIPNQSKVFEEFKSNYEYTSLEKMEIELKKIKKYSMIYSMILNPEKEKDKEIRRHLKYLKALDQNVINPFLLGVYNDYIDSKINKSILVQVMELIQNFIWRRYICGESTSGLNKIFMKLYEKIDPNNYYESIEKYIVRKNFPDDKSLKESLKIKPLYKDREKLLYVFERIENAGHNELVDVHNDNITIEHIFPQKPNENWSKLISESEYEKMLSLKDTLSNLTLTGSNSNLGNKTFIEKRDLPIKGYKDSKLFLNKWLSEQEEWNLSKMYERFNELFKNIIKIWKTPILSNNEEIADIDFYCQGSRGKGVGKPRKGKFVVFKGSKASKFLYDSVKVSNSNIIKKLIEEEKVKEENEYYILTTDCIFSSPSAAAKFILGRSANGWSEWKTYEGDTLDSFREKEE